MTLLRGVFLGIFLILAASPAFAENYYSVSVHKSKQGFNMTTMSGFKDQGSCRATAEDRSKPIDDNWQAVSSECVDRARMTDTAFEMFERNTIKEPYLAFLDDNQVRNVILFTQVPPVMVDAMLWKWQSELKKQGMKDLVIIMDPNRKKIQEMIDKAKSSLTDLKKK